MRSDAAAAHSVVEHAPAGLLAELAVHERNAVHRASEVRFFAAGDVMLRTNSPSRSAFFPISAVVSVVRPLRDGRAVAAGLFGNDGMVGIDIVLGTTRQLDEVVVQSAGFAYCIPADDMRHQFEGTGRLQKSIFRFMHAFRDQVTQNAVCIRYHTVRQRMAKWLLMLDERAGHLEVGKSRQLLAIALGVEELEIERAVTQLMTDGAIQQRRGAVAIQREALEPNACECYEMVRLGALEGS